MNENHTSPIVPRKRRKWLRIAAYIALPVFGMIIGSGATMCFMRSAMKKAFTSSPDEIAYKVTAGLSVRYELAPDQRATVHTIATTHLGNIIQIRDEVRPRIFSELESFRDEVGGVLSDEQRRCWDGNFRWMLSRCPFPTPGVSNNESKR